MLLYMDEPRPLPCEWIASIVSSIPHPSLKTVTMTIYVDNIEHIVAFELSALDTLFSNRPLSNYSTKLRLRPTEIVDREEIRTVIEAMLPQLAGGKQLELDFE